MSGPKRNLVYGLRPGDAYDYFLDGAKKATLSSSREGVIDFENSAGGKIEIIRR